MTEFEYSGSELDVFAHAKNWKAYWATLVDPFVGVNVLDVGAGIGATAENLKSRNYERWLGLEPDPNLANRIKESVKQGLLPSCVDVKIGTIRNLSVSDKFDTILYIDVLEHIEDDRSELAQACDHLLPGGHIIILAPAHSWLYTPFDKQIGHFRRYDKDTLLSAKPPHLSLERLQYIDSVGMLASLANKLLLKTARPTLSQIKMWDTFMIPASRGMDKVFLGTLGKSILCVFKR